MDEILSFCGFRCDLCLAYRPNITAHPENRQVLSDGWHTYFGFRIPPEEIHCNGCRFLSDTTLDKDCMVRPCAKQRQVETCAECDSYICSNLSQRLIDFESIQSGFDQPIPPEDRRRFILPYENAPRLAALRLKRENPQR